MRVMLILGVGLAEGILIIYFSDNLISWFKEFDNSKYSWMGPFFTMCVVSPIAFLLWWFRNSDKRIDQQHVEENIRQSDFHMLEQWATTNENGDTLQVAAIYQLLPYMKGEFGLRFIRPSMEIFRSLLESWELTAEEKQLMYQKLRPFKYEAVEDIFRPNYIRAIQTIFIQEIGNFNDFANNKYRYNLKNLNLQCIEFEHETNFSEINFQKASFELSNCLGANFHKANLHSANFECSVFEGANFDSCNLVATNFRGAVLRRVDFRKSEFYITKFLLSSLEEANFSYTKLGRCIFQEVNIKGADFRGAKFGPMSFLKIDESENLMDYVFNVNFNGSQLEGADFRGADLSGSIFLGAKNFTEAYFDDEYLTQLKELGFLEE